MTIDTCDVDGKVIFVGLHPSSTLTYIFCLPKAYIFLIKSLYFNYIRNLCLEKQKNVTVNFFLKKVKKKYFFLDGVTHHFKKSYR